MPRVLFDSQVFAAQQHGGVSRYFLELARVLPAYGWEARPAMGIHVTKSWPQPELISFGPSLRVPAIPHTVRVLSRINIALMRMYKPKNDGHTVYHPTWYDLPTIKSWGHLPLVLTIHDLIPERWHAVTNPAQLSHRRESLQRARQVLCVSQATFERLGQFYPWALEKASVARLGVSELGSRVLARAPAFPYFVYVGKRGSYKDFATVLRAFALIPDEISLVAIGGGDPKPHELARLESRLRRRVVFEPYVDDIQLAAWLDGSLGLVCASREEGFGLPPLEALARGKPVILSDIDVFRELYSKWAVFFPVGNHEALAAELEVVARTSPPGPSLAELRSEFSWSETARLTAESYGRALS